MLKFQYADSGDSFRMSFKAEGCRRRSKVSEWNSIPLAELTYFCMSRVTFGEQSGCSFSEQL